MRVNCPGEEAEDEGEKGATQAQTHGPVADVGVAVHPAFSLAPTVVLPEGTGRIKDGTKQKGSRDVPKDTEYNGLETKS